MRPAEERQRLEEAEDQSVVPHSTQGEEAVFARSQQ
jgi:hypothetical protein